MQEVIRDFKSVSQKGSKEGNRQLTPSGKLSVCVFSPGGFFLHLFDVSPCVLTQCLCPETVVCRVCAVPLHSHSLGTYWVKKIEKEVKAVSLTQKLGSNQQTLHVRNQPPDGGPVGGVSGMVSASGSQSSEGTAMS